MINGIINPRDNMASGRARTNKIGLINKKSDNLFKNFSSEIIKKRPKLMIYQKLTKSGISFN